MKHFLLVIASVLTLSAQAQTTAPTMAKLIELYSNADTVPINKYGVLLGYGCPKFGFPNIGNTYSYDHFIFSSKDTSRTKDYLTYTLGEHYPMHGYKFVSIEYGTNSQAVFDALVAEIRAMGATMEDYGKSLPGNYYFSYKNITISACTNLVNASGAKYTITIGGRGW